MNTFRYTLDPVLTQRGWTLDEARARLSAARVRLAECERAIDDTRRRQAAAWAELSAQRLDAGGIALHQETTLRRYGERLAALLQEQLATRAAAQTEHDRLREKARAALQALRGMERHKEQLHAEHEALRAGIAQREADDDWLLSHPVPLERQP